MLGKEKVYNDDIEVTRGQQMTFWEQVDQQLDRVKQLEERYGPKIKEDDFDPFNDEDLVRDIYERRKGYKFMERAELVKQRVSFFGIYCAGENVEMLYS